MAETAGKEALSFIGQHQLAIGVATTAVVVGTLAYEAYKHTSPEQREQAVTHVAKLFKSKGKTSKEELETEEQNLSTSFQSLQEILSKCTGNEKLREINNKLLEEHYSKGVIKPETILEVKKAYEAVVEQLPEKKLPEVTKLSIALLESVGKCKVLQEKLNPEKKVSFAQKEQTRATVQAGEVRSLS